MAKVDWNQNLRRWDFQQLCKCEVKKGGGGKERLRTDRENAGKAKWQKYFFSLTDFPEIGFTWGAR